MPANAQYPKGFRQKPDSRDLKYPLADLLTAGTKAPVSRKWHPGPALDQGSIGACVGYTCFQFPVSDPIHKDPVLTPLEIYDRARRIDEFDDFQEGTSLRAGLEILKKSRMIQSYHWAEDIEDLFEYVRTIGPVAIGIRWTDSMNTPDANGVIVPRGRAGGGHATFIYAANWKTGYLTIRNSWGTGFGKKGDCMIHKDHLRSLLREGGVAAAVHEAA